MSERNRENSSPETNRDPSYRQAVLATLSDFSRRRLELANDFAQAGSDTEKAQVKQRIDDFMGEWNDLGGEAIDSARRTIARDIDRADRNPQNPDYVQALSNLRSAESAFYASYLDAEMERQPSLDIYAQKFEEALVVQSARVENVLDDPERLKHVLENALGRTIASNLSPDMLNRLKTEQRLRDAIDDGNKYGMGVKIENNPDEISRFGALFQQFDGSQQPAGQAPGRSPEDDEDDDAGESVSFKDRISGWARYAVSAPFYMRLETSAGYQDRYDTASPEEKKRMKRKANLIGWMGAAAVAGTTLYLRFHGIHHDGGSGSSANAPDHGNGHHDGPIPADMFDFSHKTEMDFLNTNGRAGNDFNNIPVDTLNEPGNNGHFPGYEALQNQYQKSPAELAAELRQIQAVEQAGGHTFDALPQDLRMQSGENQEAYIARLGDAMYNDDTLHDKLTDAALDYIKDHGQTLRVLDQNYSSNYIVIEDGKPVVKLDPSVVEVDPNDRVIMLNATEGIRFPCGQPITLLPVEQTSVYQPVAAAPAVYTEQPQFVAQNTPVPQYVPEYVPTPYYPPHGGGGGGHYYPPHPHGPAPKHTPQAFADNPYDKPKGSGAYESKPANVPRSQTTNGVTERAHTNGGAAPNRPSGLNTQGSASHTTSSSHTVSSGSSTSGHRTNRH